MRLERPAEPRPATVEKHPLIGLADLDDITDFARVEALRDQIRNEYGTFPGALSHLRELRAGTH